MTQDTTTIPQETIAALQGSSQYIYEAVLHICDTHGFSDDKATQLAYEVQLFFEEQCDDLFAKAA
jgi:hypothetical protein